MNSNAPSANEMIFRLAPEASVIAALALAAVAALTFAAARRAMKARPPEGVRAHGQTTALFVSVVLLNPFFDDIFVPRYMVCILAFSWPTLCCVAGSSRRRRQFLAVGLIALISFQVANQNGRWALSLESLSRGPHDGDYRDRNANVVADIRALLEAGELLETRPADCLAVAEYNLAHCFAMPELGYVDEPAVDFGDRIETDFLPLARDFIEIPPGLAPPQVILITRVATAFERLDSNPPQTDIAVYRVQGKERTQPLLAGFQDSEHRYRWQKAVSAFRRGKKDDALNYISSILRIEPALTEELALSLLEGDGLREEGDNVAADAVYRRALEQFPESKHAAGRFEKLKEYPQAGPLH